MPPHFERDRRLVGDALAGSSDARRTFVERMRCVPRFLAVKNARMGRLLGDEELEDLVQETLATIWRRLESFGGLSSLETWAYGCCHRSLWSHLRSRTRRPLSLDNIDPHGRSEIEERMEYEDVYRALDRIAERDAAVVRSRHFDHLDFAEIARRTGVPLGSVKARYYHGLERLREILEPAHREGGR